MVTMVLTIHKIMSENKVVLSSRNTKKIELPKTKATIEIYASIIASDVIGINVASLGDDKGDNIIEAIKMLAKLIKSWNIYEKETDEKPREINDVSVGELPIEDLTFLVTELQTFIVAEKKE